MAGIILLSGIVGLDTNLVDRIWNGFVAQHETVATAVY